MRRYSRVIEFCRKNNRCIICSRKLWFNVPAEKKRHEKQAGPTAREDFTSYRPLCMEHEFSWGMFQMSTPSVALGVASSDERDDRFDAFLDANMGNRVIEK
jgi:hypothetical protein